MVRKQRVTGAGVQLTLSYFISQGLAHRMMIGLPTVNMYDPPKLMCLNA